MMMRSFPPFLLLLPVLPVPAAAQSLLPGNWDVTSKSVELVVPGAPGFLLRMMRGKSKTEHKCLPVAEARNGVATLLAPKPEAKCTIERSVIAGGHIDHVMACPQKKGPPLHVSSVGSYATTTFNVRTTMTGQTDKGPLRIVADPAAVRTDTRCRN
ncbi:DUF3617 domain-containing protein [Sphingomonas solaris]|uniref:DUF3617 family protein n=1 Tax=Alterirhizorhabdus solaris TaxID=2529389 RepID=A0A558R5V3_9SPHN|nr:DUF3617 family protein [Sphingomonas solaris]TVV74760.1 DUF3617 family protein [Sphingomonas solaris]